MTMPGLVNHVLLSPWLRIGSLALTGIVCAALAWAAYR